MTNSAKDKTRVNDGPIAAGARQTASCAMTRLSIMTTRPIRTNSTGTYSGGDRDRPRLGVGKFDHDLDQAGVEFETFDICEDAELDKGDQNLDV